jgi:hypothetical protein
MTEVNSCYRNLSSSIHAVDADTHAKLDWVESCYGTLFKHFPYATTHYVTIVEMLLAQSARVGEPNGPVQDYGMDVSRRARKCESKLEYLFQYLLGVTLDDETTTADITDTDTDSTTSGMCVWSIELWMLHIQKCVRDATRRATTMPPEDRAASIRQATLAAYETATAHAAFVTTTFVVDHIAFVRVPDPNASGNGNDNGNKSNGGNVADRAFTQQQMVQPEPCTSA